MFDAVVVGAGLVGLAAALALRHHMPHAALALLEGGSLERTGDARARDARASFLDPGALRLFKRLGVEVESQPVSDILVAEGRPGEPVREGSLHIGGEALRGGELGAVVENAHLRVGLLRALRASRIEVREGAPVQDMRVHAGHAELHTPLGLAQARLVVAADGRDSAVRRLSGIGAERRSYRQSALSFTVAHSEPHRGVAYQVFFPGGPLALLPLPGGRRSSVVWSDSEGAGRAAAALPAPALAAELRRRIGPTLGDIALETAPVVYPLQQLLAADFHAPRVTLVGEAAHVLHPLAGQGVNLGIRDAAVLAELAGEAAGVGRDPGGPALASYGPLRRGDIRGLALATDALLAAYRLPGPLGLARRLVTGHIDADPALKARIAREAAGERDGLPALMR